MREDHVSRSVVHGLRKEMRNHVLVEHVGFQTRKFVFEVEITGEIGSSNFWIVVGDLSLVEHHCVCQVQSPELVASWELP